MLKIETPQYTLLVNDTDEWLPAMQVALIAALRLGIASPCQYSADADRLHLISAFLQELVAQPAGVS
jgi:hypothetical protein